MEYPWISVFKSCIKCIKCPLCYSDLKANSRLTAEEPEEPPKSFSFNKNKALMIGKHQRAKSSNKEGGV